MNKTSKIFLKPFSTSGAERFIFFYLLLFPIILHSKIDPQNKQLLRVSKQLNQNKSFAKSSENVLKEYLSEGINSELMNWESLGPNKLEPSDYLSRKGLGRFNFIKVHPLKENEFWAGTPAGKLYKSIDYCESWQVVKTSIISTGFYDIAFSGSNPDLIIAVTGDYIVGTRTNYKALNLIRSYDSGDSWEEISVDGLSELSLGRIWLDPQDDNRFVITSFEGILLTRDGGSSFELSQSGLPFRDLEYSTFGENALYASSYDYEKNGYIYKSTDKGESWQEMVLFTNGGNIELAISQKDSSLWALVVNSNTQKMLGLYKNSDLGVNWRNQNVPYDLIEGQGFYNLALSISKTGNIAAGGINLSINNGEDWKKNNVIHVDQHYALYIKDTLFIANDGGLFKSYGSNWEFISNGIANTEFYEVESKYDNYKIAMGGSQDNGIQRYLYGDWENVLGGDGFVNAFDPVNPNKVYSSLQFGKIFSSENYGESYEEDLSIPGLSNFYTRFFLDPYNSKLYSGADKILSLENGTWETISDLNSDLMDMFFTKEKIIIATEFKLFEYDKLSKELVEIFTSESRILKVKKFENENYVLLDKDSLRLYNINKNEFLDNTLEYSYINDFSIIEDETIYVASDIGVFKKENEWVYLPFPEIENAVCTDIDYSERFNQLLVSTFGNGIWKLNLSECPEDNIQLSESGEISICENEELQVFINDFQADSLIWSDFSKNNPIEIKNYGYYYGNVFVNECVYTTDLLKVNIQETEKISIAYIGEIEPCEGDTVILNIVAPFDTERDKRDWNDGSNGEFIYVTKSGEYYWKYLNEGACNLYSDTISIKFKENSRKPIVERELDLIYSLDEANYDWFKDGQLIKENSSFVTLNSSGVYKAAYNNENGCTAFSQEFVVGSKNFQINILENGRTYDSFIIEISSEEFSQVVIEIFNVQGKKIKELTREINSTYLIESIRLDNISTGLYFLRVGVDGKTQTKKVVIN